MTTTRRIFIGDLARLAALAAIVPNDWRVVRRAWFVEDPFRIGVASGDPDPTSVVIWVGSSRVDLQACKLEYSIVSPK